jgi:hypothetical protein
MIYMKSKFLARFFCGKGWGAFFKAWVLVAQYYLPGLVLVMVQVLVLVLELRHQEAARARSYQYEVWTSG